MKTLLILTLLNNKFHTIAAAFRSYNVAYDLLFQFNVFWRQFAKYRDFRIGPIIK